MAVQFPSYLDALVEGFPTVFSATSIPEHKYIEDSQNVTEFIEKLFNRLSVLLLHMDKQIHNVLLQGKYLPNKLNQWATGARALKCQVSDLLQNQKNWKGNSLECEELVEIGIKLINHLKKCPSKDEFMYDKPIPVIISTRESGLDKPSTRFEQKYQTGSYTEDKKPVDMWSITKQSLNALQGKDDPQDQHAGMTLTSSGTSLPTIELKKTNDAVNAVKVIINEAMSTSDNIPGDENLRGVSSDVHDEVISAVSSPASNFASISEDLSRQQYKPEPIEGMTIEVSETSVSGLPTESETGLCTIKAISVRDFDSPQAVESASCEEIQVVHDMETFSGVENLSAEPRDTASSSSRTEGSKHHEESMISEVKKPVTIAVIGEMPQFVHIEQEIMQSSSSKEIQCCYNDSVPEKEHYFVNMKDNHINLKLDDQSIVIGEFSTSEPLESSRVLNLAEQDLCELPEKPGYHNPLLLFLQRNNRLTHIDFSYFENMPDLRFLDLSDTKIRILPSSLFNLSKLEVLMLRNCICLDTLPPEIGKLNHLKVLDLLGTELYSLPNEIDQLTLLRHLQLSFYGPDNESEYAHLPSELISDSVLSKLKALEALSIVVHPEDHRWKKIAASIMKNVSSLEELSFIQFYFPEVENFQDFIQVRPSWKKQRSWKFGKTGNSWEEQRLRKFKFIVGHNVKRIVSRVPAEVESLFDQQDQSLRFVNVDKVPQVIKTVLTRVTAFYLDHHIKIQSLSEFGNSSFKVLKFCVVTECSKIQEILDEKTTKVAFPSLEYLGVYYLWELKRICKTPLPSGNFKALKYLIVNTCPKLQFLLWESMLPSLSNLEELIIEDCESLEKIVVDEKKKVDYNAEVLPRLRKLVLHYLPKLTSTEILGEILCRRPEDGISIKGCPKLKPELYAQD